MTRIVFLLSQDGPWRTRHGCLSPSLRGRGGYVSVHMCFIHICGRCIKVWPSANGNGKLSQYKYYHDNVDWSYSFIISVLSLCFLSFWEFVWVTVVNEFANEQWRLQCQCLCVFCGTVEHMFVCLHTKQQVSRRCSFSKPILVCASLLFRYSSRSCVQLVLQHLNCSIWSTSHLLNFGCKTGIIEAKLWDWEVLCRLGLLSHTAVPAQKAVVNEQIYVKHNLFRVC